MTITVSPKTLIAVAIEWEIGHRIDGDTWLQAGGDTKCWYITHAEGKPSKVEENGIVQTEEDEHAHCEQNASTWWWDSSNNRLYDHTAGDDIPSVGTYIILSHFWERFGTHSPMILDGHYYLPYLSLDSIPSIVDGTSPYHQGGTRQSFGTVKIGNADGYFDSRLSTYIYEAKRMRALVGEYTINSDGVFVPAAYSNWVCVWEGWSGDISWSDEVIEVETVDLRGIRL